MVVCAVWDRDARVRFPAPRQIEKTPVRAGVFSILFFARSDEFDDN